MKKLLVLSGLLLITVWGFGQNKLTVTFSEKAGKYENRVKVKLSSNSGARIYYTTDGTQPTRASKEYRRPLDIRKTLVLSAVAYKSRQYGEVTTQTYLIKENTNFPIVSIAINPQILFDPIRGWFNKGPDADSIYPYRKANFWSRKEVSANIEIIETNGKSVFNDKVGIKLFGGMSRLAPQKSLAIACRLAYGDKRIKHKIFPNQKKKRYKHLVLRNSGSDFGKAHMRDAVITSLVEPVSMDKQAYRPALVFINGNYWGIYNMREKINRHYIADKYGLPRDSIDLIEHRRSVKHGSVKHYDKMLAYMEKNDLALPEHYNYINTQMDVSNFMTYQITQIYADNQDGGGNIKFWRLQIPEGYWRWILYDTDWGFGLQNKDAYMNNSLSFHTDPNGPSWPNPPWSTFLLRQLLKNKKFQRQFANRFADYLNTIFESNHVVNRIDSFYNAIIPEMPRHIKRWSLSKSNWEMHIERMREFADRRPAYMRNHLQTMFDIGDLVSIKIETIVDGTPTVAGGYVNLNGNVDVKTSTFVGQYFNKIPIVLKAIPKPGYQFSHWEGADAVVTEPILKVDFKFNAHNFKAVFKRSTNPLEGKIIFNEVAVNDKNAGDWVELYNMTDQDVNLKGWRFRDAKHEFTLPEAIIPANGYLILCQSVAAFENAFPELKNILGDFAFGLNRRREHIELYAVEGTSIDSFAYDIDAKDSTFTLCLKMPSLDNAAIDNWLIQTGVGSPQQHNPTFVEYLTTQAQQRQNWMIMGGGAFLLLVGLGIVMLRQRQIKKNKT